MASGEGSVRHSYIIHDDEGRTFWIIRQVYWIRYVDWIITTPLILRALTVLAGLSGAEIFFTIIFDLAMIFCVRTSVLAHNTND